MAAPLNMIQYVSAHRIKTDVSEFVGYVFDRYFDLTGNLNQSESNDHLARFMSETSMDIFSNTVFDSSVTYIITYDFATKKVNGADVSKVYRFFASAIEMSKIFDFMRFKARIGYASIAAMTLVQFAENAKMVGLAPGSSSNVWFNYYNVKSIGESRTIGNLVYDFNVGTIENILATMAVIYKTQQDKLLGFVGLFYPFTDGDLTDVQFNAMMSELFSVQRLGIWGESIDVAYDDTLGEFTGTELDIFESRLMTQKEVYGLIQLLMNLKNTHTDVSKLDFPTAVNIFENNYLGLK